MLFGLSPLWLVFVFSRASAGPGNMLACRLSGVPSLCVFFLLLFFLGGGGNKPENRCHWSVQILSFGRVPFGFRSKPQTAPSKRHWKPNGLSRQAFFRAPSARPWALQACDPDLPNPFVLWTFPVLVEVAFAQVNQQTPQTKQTSIIYPCMSREADIQNEPFPVGSGCPLAQPASPFGFPIAGFCLRLCY